MAEILEGEKAKSQSNIYRPLDFFMLRAPLLSNENYCEIFSNGETEGLTLETAVDKLLEIVADSKVREAIATASYSLLNGLAKLSDCKDERKRLQAAISLTKYLIRMSTRPTPYGTLAGITTGNFGDETSIELAPSSRYKKRARTDMEWLMGIIHRLEKRVEVVEQLRVCTNSFVQVAGDRFELAYTTRYGQQELSENKGMESVSIRATKVVHETMELAAEYIQFGELVQKIRDDYPDTPNEKIKNFFWQLFTNEFLVSELRPPMMINNNPSVLEYVIEKLAGVSGIEEELSQLKEVQVLIMQYNAQEVGPGEKLLRETIEKMNSIFEVKNPLQVDMSLTTEKSVLSKKIAQELATAADLMVRLGPEEKSSSSMSKYHQDFMEKYGSNREVPVLELLNSDKGIGAPAGYMFPPSRRTLEEKPKSQRRIALEKFILEQLVLVLKNNQSEIVMTPEVLETIEGDKKLKHSIAAVSMELCGIIAAESESAIDNGDFTIIISPNPGSNGAGKYFGRFWDMLGEDFRKEYFNINELEKNRLPEDIITAEVVYLPNNGRSANVAIAPNIRDYEIVIGTTSSKERTKTLSLSDLLIGSTGEKFYIRSKALNKQVIVSTGHMLNTMSAPNIHRFLGEVSQDGYRRWTSFDAMSMLQLPYCPAIRYGRIILSPASWRIDWQLLGAKKEEVDNINIAKYVADWRKKWQAPRYLFLTESDNRLLLDLEHPLHLAILLEELKATKHEREGLIFVDMPGGLKKSWLRGEGGGFMNEVVVPFVRTLTMKDIIKAEAEANAKEDGKKEQVPTESLQQRFKNVIDTGAANSLRNKYPGSEWLYLKLYGNSSREEEMIGYYLRDFFAVFIEQKQLAEEWFFIRYSDPDQHLRVRIKIIPENMAQVMLSLHEWFLQLTNAGLLSKVVIDTYEREVERYGGAELIRSVEKLFYYDTVLTTEAIFLKRSGQMKVAIDAVAIANILHFLESLGWNSEKQLEFLDHYSMKKEQLEEFRKNRKLFMQIGDAADDWAGLRQQEQGEILLKCLKVRGRIIGEFAKKMYVLEKENRLSSSVNEIIGSILHIHCIRLLGLNRSNENKVMELARHTLFNILQYKKVAAKKAKK